MINTILNFIYQNWMVLSIIYGISVILSFLCAKQIAKRAGDYYDDCPWGLTVIIILFPVLNVILLIFPVLFTNVIAEGENVNILTKRDKDFITIPKIIRCSECGNRYAEIESINTYKDNSLIEASYKCKRCGLFTSNAFKLKG